MRYILVISGLGLVALAVLSIASEPPSPPGPSAFAQHVAPLIGTYCLDCHSGETPEGALDLEPWAALTDWPAPEAIVADEEHLTRMAAHLEDGVMPPELSVRPESEAVTAAVGAIRAALEAAYAVVPPDPGRVTIRRLNRTEYANTVRDLLGVTIDPVRWLPRDEAGYGFDHIGDVLSMPPSLLEKYLDVAEHLSERVIVAVDPENPMRRVLGSAELRSAGNVRDAGGAFALLSSSTVYADVSFERAGVYVIRARAFAQQAGPDLAQMQFQVAGKGIETIEVGAERGDPRDYEVQVPIDRGSTRIGVAFTNDYYRPDSPDPKERDRNLFVQQIEIEGPLADGLGPAPEMHARIMTRVPLADGSDLRAAAAAVVGPLARRAYRRPVTGPEVARLVDLVELAVNEGDSFERGAQLALQALLVSPHFLFRVEIDPDPTDAKATHPIDEHELASRLSYFLWSSMPDEALFSAASEGTLVAEIDRHVARMLADPKAENLVTNFAAQWLQLPRLAAASPDPKAFPAWSEPLRQSMRLETELFVGEIFRDDRSILELLVADFAWLDAALAKHYGMPDLVPATRETPVVPRDAFQRVALPEAGQRGGLLTQASILTLTSYPTRTSAVIRGKYVLEQLLADPPPPPPPGVGVLEDQTAQQQRLSLRERLAIHREDPSCASCHVRMDALGFGLERFDAIGRFRTKDGAHGIEAGGALPSGQTFDGPRALEAILAEDEAFPRAFAGYLLTFALGRGIESLDRRALEAILLEARAGKWRFSAFVRAIVRSPPFRNRRGEASE